jgi:hypothetical protein
VNSIRFDGIYLATDGELAFRLEESGSLHARFFTGSTKPAVAAQSLAPGTSGYGSGSYELEGDKIRLRVSFPGRDSVYEGQVIVEGLELRFIKQGRENPPFLYAFHQLTPDELAPSLAARAHEVRVRLEKGEITRQPLEVAAALGDPAARLALHPALDIANVAEGFAKLGSVACVRLLLAMSWSDDGNFFRPMQSLTTGGGRGDDQGKVLRSLAKWCLKPDIKTLEKAKEQLSDVGKTSKGSAFLQLAIKAAGSDVESERSAAVEEALRFNVDRDPYLASEEMQKRIVPWLMGGEDWLAEHLKRIK